MAAGNYVADKAVAGANYAANKSVAAAKFTARAASAGASYVGDQAVSGAKWAGNKAFEGIRSALDDRDSYRLRGDAVQPGRVGKQPYRLPTRTRNGEIGESMESDSIGFFNIKNNVLLLCSCHAASLFCVIERENYRNYSGAAVFLLPLQGEGRDGDGVIPLSLLPHPHPNHPLEGEGIAVVVLSPGALPQAGMERAFGPQIYAPTAHHHTSLGQRPRNHRPKP